MFVVFDDVRARIATYSVRINPQVQAALSSDTMKLDSSVSAVVTGGASGLGAATARRLASHGVKVALFDRDEERGRELAREIHGVFCRVDVTRDEDVDTGFRQARQAHGQERVLVNCAGTGNAIKTASRDKKTGEIRHFPLADFERIVQINLIGTFRCVAKSAAGMLALAPLEGGERGAIVNTASVAAQDGQAGQASYAASKAGVAGMTLPIARDLMNDGIRVNTILPGIFDTPLLQALPDHVRGALGESVPFPKRLGAPHEYAELAEFLVTSGYMNGECIRIDGAIRMAPR
jgi:NAD(P)-dependent dehydrogenase (short-subunit alcohol dehydrogenase family)